MTGGVFDCKSKMRKNELEKDYEQISFISSVIMTYYFIELKKALNYELHKNIMKYK